MKPKKLEFVDDGDGVMVCQNELGAFAYGFFDPVYECYVGGRKRHETPDLIDAENFLQSENDKAARTLFEPDTLTPKLVAFIRETVETYGKPGGPWNIPSDPGSWLARGQELLKLVED